MEASPASTRMLPTGRRGGDALVSALRASAGGLLFSSRPTGRRCRGAPDRAVGHVQLWLADGVHRGRRGGFPLVAPLDSLLSQRTGGEPLRFARRARKTAMFIFSICVMPVALAPRVNEWLAVFLIGLAVAAHQPWSATTYASASDMFPERTIAALAGIGGAVGSLGGILFPLLPGGCSTTTSSRRGANPPVTPSSSPSAAAPTSSPFWSITSSPRGSSR